MPASDSSSTGHGWSGRTPETERWGQLTFAPEPAALREARRIAEERRIPPIALGPVEAKLIQIFLRLAGARRVVEVGTLYGYSGSWIAGALPDEGRLWTCELDERYADTASEVFRMTGVADRVSLLRGPALDSLASIEGEGPFDAIFIDADKERYPAYLDWAERNVRPGGLVIGDNTYYFGHIHRDPDEVNERVRAGLRGMQEFNRRLADPERYHSVLIPTGEGLTVAVKRF